MSEEEAFDIGVGINRSLKRRGYSGKDAQTVLWIALGLAMEVTGEKVSNDAAPDNDDLPGAAAQ